MKLIKFLTSFLLFFIAFVFVGEIYVWNLNSFETEYKQVTFYLQEDTTKSEMVHDIYETAIKEKVEVFVVVKKVISLFSADIDIYGTSTRAFEYLSLKSDIKAGKFDSIFLGSVNIGFHNWMNLPDISKIENYYVIGKEENILNFKKSLVDKYAGKFPKGGYKAINSSLNMGIVWTCVALFLLLLTLYEVARLKKAIILRITIGEQVIYFIIKQIIGDVIAYLIIFIGLMHILGYYTNTYFQKNISYLFFSMFLVLNSLVYLWLLFTDYKKDMQTKKSVQNVLKISYVYKILTSIIMMIAMTGCIELIFEGINVNRQKAFFEERKDYAYITVGGGNIEEAKKMLNLFYNQAKIVQKETSLVDLKKWQTEVEYILADQGAVEYIYTRIPEVQDIILEDKIYFLVPDKYFEQQEVIEDMLSICDAYFKADGNYEIIKYEKTVSLMAISNEGKIKSTLKQNPVVILNNIKNMEIPNSSILYLVNSTIFSLSDKEFADIAYRNNFEDELHYKTNIYENYMYFWSVTKRNMLMGMVFLLIMLLLEGFILKSILKYEYQINAKELLLSKIHGDGFFHRHRKIIIILSGGWLSLIIAITIGFIFNFSSTIYIIISGVFITLIEHLFIAIYSHKLDTENISKIFKGGML